MRRFAPVSGEKVCTIPNRALTQQALRRILAEFSGAGEFASPRGPWRHIFLWVEANVLSKSLNLLAGHGMDARGGSQ
jgi:hypothetical protein